ncbi:cytochrome P450 [Apodospora peruviana]|uniref:Cytochrome P450 n=1 Tax=Apodospora peruviana TaxID=516989 RepID=A0AAE0M1S2_9PEZI|nr:cytochrome P450 [Apodospora peruviana]
MALSTPSPMLVLVAVVALLIFAASSFRKKPDLREPPYVSETIPYVSHIYGLLKHGLRYFDLVSAQQPHPIFTIELPGQKNYIVTSPELVQAVQRNVTSLSFSPAMIPAFRRMMDIDEEGISLIFKDAHMTTGFYGEIHRIQKASLLPGTESLDQLCNLVRTRLMHDVNNFPSVQVIDLYAWIQDLFMRSNNSACFGDQDPFTLDSSLNATFWQWEANIKTLLLGIPWILNPTSYTAAKSSREKLVAAFTTYLNSNGLSSACSFIQGLSGLGIGRGLSTENNAKALIGSILAIVGNTIPTTFWLLVHVYSRPALLLSIRAELEAIMTSPSDMSGVISLSYVLIKEKCPVFLSVYDEVLRLTSGIATVRYTMEDTLINDTWLLKKSAQVQMPTAYIHTDPTTWGSDAEQFDAERFLEGKVKRLSREERTKRNAAFRPFGGGNVMCPGRHFASHEVLGFVGTVFLGWDMEPVVDGNEEKGGWKVPEMDRSKLPLTSLKPATDVKVRLVRREGWEKTVFE